MKPISLVIVDSRPTALTRFSIEKSLENIDVSEVITFTPNPIIEGATHVPVTNINSLYDYSEFVLKQLWPYIKTDYCLVTQWDGMAANGIQWTEQFLEYDYIGAPWPWSMQGQHVGNGGFSLRSRRLIDACRDQEVKLQDQNEDVAICVDNRQLLSTKYQIKVAPVSVAERFSIENYRSGNTFGFHGIWNAPRFFPKKDLDYIFENLPPNFWKDASKVREWVRVLIEYGNHELVHKSIERMNLNENI